MKRLLLTPFLLFLTLPVKAEIINYDCKFRGKLGNVGIVANLKNQEELKCLQRSLKNNQRNCSNLFQTNSNFL